MAFENDLYRLGGMLADSIEELQAAQRLADRILCDVPAGSEDLGWPAMEVLVGQLEAINKLLAELPSPEIADAVKQAGEYLDEMSDRADGISY